MTENGQGAAPQDQTSAPEGAAVPPTALAAHLATIVESSQDAIFSRAVDGAILSWNAGAERLYGWTAAEMVGRNVSLMIPTGRRQEAAANWERLRSGLSVPPYETVRIAKDGHAVAVSLSLSPLKDADGRLVGAAIISRDISRLKQVEEALRRSEHRLRTIIELEPDGVSIVSADGRLIEMNRSGLDMLEVHSVADIERHGLLHFIAPAARAAVTQFHDTVATGARAELEYEIVGLQGTRRTVHTTATPFSEPGVEEIRILAVTRDVTERRSADEARANLAAIVESSNDAIISRSLDGYITSWNRGAERLFGYTAREVIGQHVDILAPPGETPRLADINDILQQGGITEPFEAQRVAKDGRLADVMLSHSPLRNDEGEVTGASVIFHDVTERKRAEQQLVLASRAIASAAEGIMITDAQRRIVNVNEAFTRITGYPPEEVIGRTPDMFSAGRDAGMAADVWEALAHSGHWQGEIWNRRRNGEAYAELMTISAVKDTEGRTTHYVAVFNDISPLKEYEARLEYLAHHDSLTGLPTRSLLRDRVEVAIAHAERDGRHLALLFIDLDRFKLINDTLGHDVGDQLLQAVSLRLKDTLRSSDTVSRHGGDEFLVLLPSMPSVQDAGRVAEKLIAQIAQPFELDHHELVVTTSIGIAVYPDNGRDLDHLLRNADAAMYAAKQAGRNRYQYYTDSMNVQAADRLTLERELRLALERNEIGVLYQPQMDLHTGALVGVEALMCWRHPVLGDVPPARFIPIAEDSGLIIGLGAWILDAACRQRVDWRQRGVLDAPVAVNVSALQLRLPNFVQRVAETLADHGLAAGELELEVTESLLMQGSTAMIAALHELHRMGVRLALDDFGTGYSSLSYLRQFPLDRMKMDQSFVRDLPHDGDAVVIAEAIATLGRALGLRVVAEGVETEAQARFLRGTWCEEAQGYHYCRPLPAHELEIWLQQRTAVAS